MPDLLITHATLVTVDPSDTVLEDGALLIRGQRIAGLGATADLAERHPDAEVLDAAGMVAMPGLVNTHSHMAATMVRSAADDVPPKEWGALVWSVTDHFDEQSIYDATLLALVEMIAGGTTCVNDHHPYAAAVAQAVEQAGLRAELADTVADRLGHSKGESSLRRAVEFARQWHGRADGRIRARIGPHALYTCSTELLLKARDAARELGVGMHMHVAESAQEIELVGPSRAGATSAQHLRALGVLSSDFVVAHGLTLNADDARVVAEAGASIAHCPQTYGKMGITFPNVEAWQAAGIAVGLGTDGPGSTSDFDLFEEMRFATLARKLLSQSATALPAPRVLRMATIDGARALGLGREIGSLEVGKKADLILVDFHRPHLTPSHNVVNQLVYGARASDVDTVIVDGRAVYRRHAHLTLDVDDILDRAQQTFLELTHKAGWRVSVHAPRESQAEALARMQSQQAVQAINRLRDI